MLSVDNKSSAGVGALKHMQTTVVQMKRNSESLRKIVADLQSSLRCVNMLFFNLAKKLKDEKTQI